MNAKNANSGKMSSGVFDLAEVMSKVHYLRFVLICEIRGSVSCHLFGNISRR